MRALGKAGFTQSYTYFTWLNSIRRENRALHSMRGLRFYPSSSPHVLFYGKMTPARDNVILVAVNLDPFATHETTLELPLEEIGIAADETYELHELLADQRRLIRGARHTVSLDPRVASAHVYRVLVPEQLAIAHGRLSARPLPRTLLVGRTDRSPCLALRRP